MKFKFLCLLVTVAVISVCGWTDKNAARVTYSRAAVSLKCTKAGPVCTEDCATLMMCSSLKPDPLSQTICTAPKQYCVNGACTSIRGTCTPNAESGSSNFECTEVGIFPDPSDCTRYHVCEQDSTSTIYCKDGFVYNSKLKMCQMGRTPCTRISCSRASEANTFISYASDPAYYAFCSEKDGKFKVLMFKCPNEEFNEFDMKTKTCQFKCKARGNFQNPEDCEKYFYCSRAHAEPVSAECPEDLVFDGTRCNVDREKCQYKPQVDLTEAKPLELDVTGWIVEFDEEIKKKMCTLTKREPDCIKAIEGKKFRQQTFADRTEYFVSVMSVDTPTDFYHVKIISKLLPKKVQVKNVLGPKKETDDIVAF